MSVEALAWAWGQKRCGDRPLRGNAKLVLLALADHADGKGVCWPGRRGIAAKVGISPGTVTKLLGQLEAGGLIGRHARFEEEGRQTSSRYLLPITQPPTPKGVRGVRGEAEAPSSRGRTQEPSTEPSTESSSPTSTADAGRVPPPLRVVEGGGGAEHELDQLASRLADSLRAPESRGDA